MSNIYKVMSTLLREYDFELADEAERASVLRGDFVGKIPDMISVGISDLEGRLMVRVRRRDTDAG